jgi:serine phosphatase RsbU (regulator of sigma subunit)/anti-sigma regulatory factor (Ser/Thr protein kinase)
MSNFWQTITGKKANPPKPVEIVAHNTDISSAKVEEIDISLDDSLIAYLVQVANPVEIEKLKLKSPTLDHLRSEGVKVIVPLVSQGELIGLINLGARRSEQEYSSDDRRLLNTLATQAAPALRVAQLARQQQIEARERERMEQELKVARVIQQTLLPKEVPELRGWNIAAFWQPAKEVSGDFYDFFNLVDGRTCILIGDVTDKGVPAAMVMATTRSLLRAAAERLVSPGKVLERVNDLLYPDIPAKMFVTCLCVVLDPGDGKAVIANAGHNLPYLKLENEILEPRASGMPLGLMPGMTYDEVEFRINPGESLLLLSDGLVEAHNSDREMFGLERVKRLLALYNESTGTIEHLMSAFHNFTGEEYEQEDDITLVTIIREPQSAQEYQEMTVIAEFDIASAPGNERQAAYQVIASLGDFQLSEHRLKHLETAVAEATMNAMEHGNHYDLDKPVNIRVLRQPGRLVIQIQDQGGNSPIPEAEIPDLDAKLAGLQSPRGWGLFLIQQMVDEMNTFSDETHHTMELILILDEGQRE